MPKILFLDHQEAEKLQKQKRKLFCWTPCSTAKTRSIACTSSSRRSSKHCSMFTRMSFYHNRVLPFIIITEFVTCFLISNYILLEKVESILYVWVMPESYMVATFNFSQSENWLVFLHKTDVCNVHFFAFTTIDTSK